MLKELRNSIRGRKGKREGEKGTDTERERERGKGRDGGGKGKRRGRAEKSWRGNCAACEKEIQLLLYIKLESSGRYLKISMPQH